MTVREIAAADVEVGMILSLPRYFERVTVTGITYNEPERWDVPTLVFTVAPPRFLPGKTTTTDILAALPGETLLLVEE